AACIVVGAVVLAAGAPGLVGAVRAGHAADPERRAQAASALQLHGVLLALCALLAVGVVVYAARDPLGADEGGEGGEGAVDGDGGGGADRTGAAAGARAELAAVRGELAAAREHHVAERDSLLRERAALAERIGGLQAGVQGTFVGLSRRTLGLVERQLSFIDELEAHEQEPGTLDTLFRLDHLAACMRRHSENQLVLAGADHRGTRRAHVPLIDVLRAAVGEIESYQRVVLSPDVPQLHVTGFASADVSHLLAELLENATSCSPPESEVLLTGRLLGTGDLLLVVRDEGIGISPPGRLDALNARLAEADPGPAPGESLGLGLYVVARLAARHGVRVELRRRERGLDAEVRLPARLSAGAVGGGDGAVSAGGAAGGGALGGAVAGGVAVGGGAVGGAAAGRGGGAGAADASAGGGEPGPGRRPGVAGEGVRDPGVGVHAPARRGAHGLAPVRDGGCDGAHGPAPVPDGGGPVRPSRGPDGPGAGAVRLGPQRPAPPDDGPPSA
ncbi:sensor histidine kinase, partial [Streptomyces synnematoformans]|uniref:sensor histidine kinase n=1 Tax=Streptomyces synnematoformans TaxID=415721 RepID=UPI0031D547EA